MTHKKQPYLWDNACMRYVTVLLLIAVCGVVGVSAQTDTPTPTETLTPTPLPTTTPAPTPDIEGMVILYPGDYESSNGAISRAGDWYSDTCAACVDNEVLFTDVNGTMHIRFYGDGISVARLVGPEYGPMEVCANGWCSLVSNYDAGELGSVPHTVLLRPGYWHVSLRNSSVLGARLAVDAITIYDDSQTYTVPTPTAFPTATPDVSLIESTLVFREETITGHYQLSITAGELAITVLLGVIATILVTGVVLWLWKTP